MTTPPRLRFAPSPTGMLHIGGARTALFNWAFARRHGGAFVLRVEDTDRARSTAENEAAILDGLRWLGMDWDEGPDVGGPFGPYRQSERHERHLGVAAGLFQAGWAYRCFCSSERLAELRAEQEARKETPRYDGRCRDLDPDEGRRRMEAGERPVLRFRVPEGSTGFSDLIRGDVSFSNAEVDDWIMVRSDGAPTYNLVVVCDDVDMEISHVCRGEEHIVNTPKQVLLYRALGVSAPAFAHVPLMLGTDGKKLSKRTGDTALQHYRDEGYPPEAVMNFLCLQGWALDGETEVFSLEQLVEHFSFESVSKGGSIFDQDKFRWLAGEYVRSDSVEHLAGRCAPFVIAAELMTAEELDARHDWYLRAVAMMQERIQVYSELPAKLAFLFAPDDAVAFVPKAEAGAKKHEGAPARLSDYLAWLRPQLPGALDADGLRAATKAWVGEQGIKFPALFQPLRCALTGEPGGPDLFEVMALLGPERTVARIEAGIARLG